MYLILPILEVYLAAITFSSLMKINAIEKVTIELPIIIPKFLILNWKDISVFYPIGGDMNRRLIILIVLTGLVLVAVIVGFVWYQNDSCQTPIDLSVETQYTKSSVLSERGLAELGAPGANEDHHRTITNASAARYYLENGSAAEAFALETDFDDSYALMIVSGDSSVPRLELRCVQRDGRRHVVEAAFTRTSGPRTADIRTHSLLLRISDKQIVAPDNVTVRVTGHEMKPIYRRW